MNKYTATIKHSAGNYKVTETAKDEATAREIICKAEHCTNDAIIKLTSKPQLYKVVKIMRKTGNRLPIERGLTIDEAKRLVNSYPDSASHMVCFIAQ